MAAGLEATPPKFLQGAFVARYNAPMDGSPPEAVSLMLDAIERLSPESRRMWDESLSCKFSARYEYGDHPGETDWHVSAEIRRRLGNVHATFFFTVYASSKIRR